MEPGLLVVSKEVLNLDFYVRFSNVKILCQLNIPRGMGTTLPVYNLYFKELTAVLTRVWQLNCLLLIFQFLIFGHSFPGHSHPSHTGRVNIF